MWIVRFLEANAAMKNIMGGTVANTWKQYIVRLMREEGVIEPTEEPSDEDVQRCDKKRKDKKVSNRGLGFAQ